MKKLPLLTGVVIAVASGLADADQGVASKPMDSAQPDKATLQKIMKTKENDPAIGGFENGTDYWTAERYKKAKALPLPQVEDPAADPTAARSLQTADPPVRHEGKPPTVKETPETYRQLFIPDAPTPDGAKPSQNGTASDEAQVQGTPLGDTVPLDFGTSGARFSSQRLAPLSADRSYPYRAVGKLFFTKPGIGNFVCSAAVIKPRLILTAGHCVHNGNGSPSGFFTNFRFAPAFRDGTAPYGAWSATAMMVTTTWATGGGGFPNAADYALIELQDQLIAGIPTRIGNVVGWFGFQTNSLLPNHAHLLGYPGAFDGGVKMHQVTAASFSAGGNNTVLYGSDMTRGSSGGPWVMNFGFAASGQTGGLQRGRNLIVGVTSYGPNDPSIKVAGSSIFDSRLVGILNTMCTHQPGNC